MYWGFLRVALAGHLDKLPVGERLSSRYTLPSLNSQISSTGCTLSLGTSVRDHESNSIQLYGYSCATATSVFELETSGFPPANSSFQDWYVVFK